jgi:glycosyltransferase involved in cell wall biosynthesis
MSAFNDEKFLIESLESVIGQTYRNFELILFDDGSKDATSDIIREYAGKDKRIIPVFNDRNLGLTVNLNRGIKLSRGVYIARMDADDISMSTRFEKQVSFLDLNPGIDLVGSASADINSEGNEIQLRTVPEKHQDIINLLPKANPITHSAVMFRKKSFESIDFYNESYRTIQDYEMWFRAAGKGLKFHNMSEVLLKYRMDDDYVSRKSFSYRISDCKLRLKCFHHINLPYYKYYYALIPVFLGLIPRKLYPYVKRIDPRMQDLN